MSTQRLPQSLIAIKELGVSFKAIFCSLLLVLAFFLLKTGALGSPALSLSITQYVLFPFVCVFLSMVVWPVYGLKLRVLLPLSLIFVGVTIYFFGALTLHRSDFVFAPLEGDELQARSSRFQKLVQAYVERDHPAELGSFYRPIRDVADAESLMKKKKSSAIIWGDENWIRVSFGRGAYTKPAPIEVPLKREKVTLKLSRHVPAVGLAFVPMETSAEFISLLLRAQSGPRNEARSYLRSAAAMRSIWSTFAHLAYPYWKLGNVYLEQYLAGDPRDLGELDCALDAYSQGASYLQPNDNPLLRAALFSNKAVALLLARGPDGGSKKEAKGLLRKAREIAVRSDPFGARSGIRKIIDDNLRALTPRAN